MQELCIKQKEERKKERKKKERKKKERSHKDGIKYVGAIERVQDQLRSISGNYGYCMYHGYSWI